jgi:FlaA1/EpsC-like NDP-sugar epimerase
VAVLAASRHPLPLLQGLTTMTGMFSKRQRLKLFKVFCDGTVLAGAYCLAFLVRFEGAWPAEERAIFALSFPVVVLVQWFCLLAVQVPNRSWRHVSLVDARCLFTALTFACGILISLRLGVDAVGGIFAVTGWGEVSLGVLLIDFPFAVIGIVGMRAGYRYWMEGDEPGEPQRPEVTRIRTLLIGAGRAGAMVLKELLARPDLGVEPVGFLDDDPDKLGRIIHGIRVMGPTADLEKAVKATAADQVLLTISGLPGSNVGRIRKACEKCGIGTKVIPGISEMVEGKINISTMREVSLEDLLRRAPVELERQIIAANILGRRVVVTGAGGSIGSQLCEEVCRFAPAVLLLIEKTENSLFYLNLQLRKMFPDVKIVPYLADVCDAGRMHSIFATWKPHVVFHAAAHKHVPVMERNPGEAIKNNVLGTRFLADLSHSSGVSQFVLISTDKAVNPTSVMGVSKRIAELYLQAISQQSRTKFVTVRFGNVLGSNGSVIPIFRDQLARGGPLTVTHPDMKRYFMTIPEACQLVLQAAAMGQGGELFILDMGEQVRILDLANDLIRLSGFTPEDIGIEFIGMRPGEKLFEELSFQDEQIQNTRHPRIFVGRLAPRDQPQINKQIDELKEATLQGDMEQLFSLLKRMVPEYERDETSWLEPLASSLPGDSTALTGSVDEEAEGGADAIVKVVGPSHSGVRSLQPATNGEVVRNGKARQGKEVEELTGS